MPLNTSFYQCFSHLFCSFLASFLFTLQDSFISSGPRSLLGGPQSNLGASQSDGLCTEFIGLSCRSTAQVEKGGRPASLCGGFVSFFASAPPSCPHFLCLLTLLAFRTVTRPGQLPHGLGHSGGGASKADTDVYFL